MFGHLLVTIFLSILIIKAYSITCYDCRADDSTCNEGECTGAVCVKMETANLDNERRTVHKMCSEDYEETQCKQSTFGSKMIIRCTCDTGAFCNGEEALAAAGLIASKSPSIILPSFLLIFLPLYTYLIIH